MISDAHGCIKAAIATVLSEASRRRCRTHFMANLASRVPKCAWPMIAALARSIFEQVDRDATWNQLGEVVSELTEAGFNYVAPYLLDAADDILAFSALSTEHWPKIRSNNPQERLNKEIRRRTDIFGTFPNRQAVIRLVGALLAEQTDEWAIAKRYMSVEFLKAPHSRRLRPVTRHRRSRAPLDDLASPPSSRWRQHGAHHPINAHAPAHTRFTIGGACHRVQAMKHSAYELIDQMSSAQLDARSAATGASYTTGRALT